MRPVLFVGGPWNGHQLMLDRECSYFDVAFTERHGPAAYEMKGDRPEFGIVVHRATYHAHTVPNVAEGGYFCLMVLYQIERGDEK